MVFALESTPLTTLPGVYETFTAYDDDYQPIDVLEPYTTLLPELFEPAYIEIIEYIYDTNCDFDENCHYDTFGMPDELANELSDDMYFRSSQMFWAAYVQGMFQSDMCPDFDSSKEDGTPYGTTSHIVGGSAIWMEQCRDMAIFESYYLDQVIEEIVGHELGHQFFEAGYHHSGDCESIMNGPYCYGVRNFVSSEIFFIRNLTQPKCCNY